MKEKIRYYGAIILTLVLSILSIYIILSPLHSKMESHVVHQEPDVIKVAPAAVPAKADAVPDVTTVAVNQYYDVPLDEQYQDYVVKICKQYGISTILVLAVMDIESDYDFMALSADRSCVGIMQVNVCNYDDLHRAIGITDLRDPYQNIESGIYILSQWLNKYDDLHKALVCYNCGESGGSDKLTSSYSFEVVNTMADIKIK